MRIFGSILCIVAVFFAIGIITGPKRDTAQNTQEWALFAVLFLVGIALSKKIKPDDTDTK